MEIRVHNLGGYMLNNYLLETPLGVIAIDTGYPGGAQGFLRRFVRHWPLTELKYVFLTHHHDDHAGFLKDLLVACDARVVLHPLALPQLRAGKNAEPPGEGYSGPRPGFRSSKRTSPSRRWTRANAGSRWEVRRTSHLSVWGCR